MKILMIADTEERRLWDDWTEETGERLSDIGLILSAGDLDADYLEFLVTMLNVPLVYVRGNHDGDYDRKPPEGCISADGRLVEVECRLKDDGQKTAKVRVLGFGGSVKYRDGAPDMYTEREMAGRVRTAGLKLAAAGLAGSLRGKTPAAGSGAGGAARPAFDIMLTHAPCKDLGDLDDLPHNGFECFNSFLNKFSPQLHCYGHVHKEYGQFFAVQDPAGDSSGVVKGFHRTLQHPSGTILINASGHYLYDLEVY